MNPPTENKRPFCKGIAICSRQENMLNKGNKQNKIIGKMKNKKGKGNLICEETGHDSRSIKNLYKNLKNMERNKEFRCNCNINQTNLMNINNSSNITNFKDKNW